MYMGNNIPEMIACKCMSGNELEIGAKNQDQDPESNMLSIA